MEKIILDFQLVPLSHSKRVITGKVYDETTKKPIKGAKVELLTSNGMRISSKQTNKKGICHFKDLPQGKYSLIVRSKGYQKARKKIKLGKGHSILKVLFHLNVAD
ncbi:carboxypeptidase regulatory-like domain-containing protein [Peribacillus simplex]|uniref:carboxypeptidase regulatory-like domain-containing protein n=1 Tax=Peribacillus simplex TaxID=1478 RepID=UPI00333C076D